MKCKVCGNELVQRGINKYMCYTCCCVWSFVGDKDENSI